MQTEAMHTLYIFINSNCLCYADPPSQPIDVTITAVGATWAVIIWSPPIAQGSCSVSSYLVTATPSMQPIVGDCVEVECKSVIVQIESVSINISQLIPGVRHVLTVSALSNGTNLKSLPSKEVEVTTANSGMFYLHGEDVVRKQARNGKYYLLPLF